MSKAKRMMSVRVPLLKVLSLLLAPVAIVAQPVTITVHAGRPLGEFKPAYRYFGYDEANNTYSSNGRKLVRELAELSSAPVYIRTHFLLATGNGETAFKWGSTNAYTEDGSGNPIYDWSIVDRILDTWLGAGAKPFVEIGFMPRALSSKPDPYQSVWWPGASFENYYLGWTYPPKSYAKWGELVYQWVRHEVSRHGADEVASWYWEVWNEPDIRYWHGTPEEYGELYDYAAAGVRRALPQAKVGGPASTGPASARAGAFLRQFLEHCARGENFASHTVGAPLDFITFHAKGRPSVVDGHVRMGIAAGLDDVDQGFRIVRSLPEFRDLPIVLSECDPEGCAACSARVYPQNAYRNGPLYAAYTAAVFSNILRLARRDNMNIEGMLTWAFEFDGQPWFDGFRTLATNGVDKPVLNVFRMLGLMRGQDIEVESSGAVPLSEMISTGVRGQAAIDAMATRHGDEVSVLAWNYHDEDVAVADASLRVIVSGLSSSVGRVLVRHYRIDGDHSNAWTVWKQMGSPQNPSAGQYARLESAGHLQLLDSPRWLPSHGEAEIDFRLPREAVSLIGISW